MEIHYNAFISYRHHPEDIRIATQIHRALEHFRVPKAIRRNAKLPLRLFRDKDELPITSNLSDDIFAALEHSDFLIVICSEHTKESLWVQREIETFLRFHSRDRILTVLAGGEPMDVIPEILLYNDITDPITGETRREMMEPLSCDWRIGRRKAMREELPRLAAALLHCGYDDLRQRQKQYRMRQLIAAGSVALAASVSLTAYFLYTSITIQKANVRIQENLDQALRNQSQHLGTAAQAKLEEGDRLTAIALLLEALPSEETPRPYVPEVEYVLSEALGVYSGDYEMVSYAVLNPGGGMVTDMMITEDTEIIYIRDGRSIITGWDIETLERISTIDPHAVIDGLIGTTPENGILLKMVTDNALLCYGRDGTLNWMQEKVYSACMSEDGAQVYVIRHGDSDTRYLDVYDADSGVCIAPTIAMGPQNGELPYSFALDKIRPGFPIPIEFMDDIYLLNPDTGEWIYLMTTENLIKACRILDNGNYLLMVGDGTGMMNGVFGSMNTTSPMNADILCFSPAGKMLWKSKITTCDYTSTGVLEAVPDTPWIFCQMGDTLQLIHRENGEVIQTCNAASPVVTMIKVTDEYAMGFLKDGTIFDYLFSSNQCNALDYNLEGDLRKGAIGDSIFTISWDSTYVTCYAFNEVKSIWEFPLEQDAYCDEFRQQGSQMVMRVSSEICKFDMQSQSFLWKIPCDDMKLMDYSSDGSLIWANGLAADLVSIDTETGKRTDYDVEWKREDRYLGYLTGFVQNGDLFYFLAKDRDALLLCCVQPISGEMRFYDVFAANLGEIPEELKEIAYSTYYLQSYIQDETHTADKKLYTRAEEILAEMQSFDKTIAGACVLHIHGNRIWILDADGRLFCVDTETGTSEVMLTGVEGRPVITVRESDGAFAIATGTELLLYLPDTEEPIRATLQDERIGTMRFHEEALLTVTDTGYLQRFNMALQPLERDGLTISYSFNTDLFSKYSDIRDITWQFGLDQHLYLNLFGIMNVIDCEYWSSTAYVPQCVAYDMEEEVFLCKESELLRGFPNYDTQELMDLAEDVLGSFTLTEQQRKAYGLGS